MSKKADGLFYAADNEKEPFKLDFRWLNSNGGGVPDGDDGQGRPDFAHFRLERISSSPGSPGLPVQPVWFNSDSIGEAFILVGEQGSGMDYFKNWVQQKTGRDWLAFRSHGMKETGEQDSPFALFKNNSSSRIFLDRTYDSFKGKQENPNIIAKWARELDACQFDWGRPRLICLTYDPEYFKVKTDPIFSLLSDRVHVYRLPRFYTSELKIWVKALFANHKQLDVSEDWIDNIAAQAYQLIGGQPLLTHLLFRRLDDLLDTAKPTSLSRAQAQKYLRRCANAIQYNPPSHARRWKTILKDLLQKDAAMLDLMRRYVAGSKKPAYQAFPIREVVLFIGGWLGYADDFNQKDWGIASESHAHWAREVIQDLKQGG